MNAEDLVTTFKRDTAKLSGTEPPRDRIRQNGEIAGGAA